MIEKICLEALKEGIQIRCGVNAETVERYTEKLKEWDLAWNFPNVTVVVINRDYFIADGHHRLLAAIQAGLSEIPCDVIEGTEETLLEKAFEGNAQHGLPMTKADLQHAREQVVLKYPEKSDRDLARICGCSPATICRVKKELEERNLLERPQTVIDSIGRKQTAKKKMCFNETRPTQTAPPAMAEKMCFNETRPTQTAPPPAMAENLVFCTVCKKSNLKDLAGSDESPWRERGLDDGGNYIWLCSDECESEWNERKVKELEAEQTQPVELEEKPQKEKSCVIAVALTFTVKGAENPKEAFESVKRGLPMALQNRKISVLDGCIFNINNININQEIINKYTQRPSENFTDFRFVVRDKNCETLSVRWVPKKLYEELKEKFPTLDTDKTLTECADWFNGMEGEETLTNGSFVSRIRGWFQRTLKNAEKEAARSKSYSQQSGKKQTSAGFFSDEDYE